ncbi:uncharacterized protein LOC123681801 [Harmonia axyridis]|uniref:uncharacterized protein LOC123681801 n=1 Tax=Harmonia axyridis TaxID=115357 RepID=UPI001E278FEA|nr:uncharacterized protein LOC123681801 [Harmonia axyridis]
MSEIIKKYENIFKILHQDHSYFLASPRECNSKTNLKKEKYIPRIFLEEDRLAALKIKKFLCSARDKRIYNKIKSTLFEFVRKNPIWILKRLDYMCYTLFEKNNYELVFRLAGESFPPHIVYKVFNRFYAISSLNSSMLNSKLKIHSNNTKKTLKSCGYQNIYNEWKVCYVYKREKKELKDLRLKKNKSSKTWISEKYGP